MSEILTGVVAEQAQLDIEKYTLNKKQELMKLPEIEKLTSQIEVFNPDSILKFGQEASVGIASMSDQILNTIKLNKNEDNANILIHLTRIMDKFDIDDFQNTKEPGFLDKIFKKTTNIVEVMFKKYETLGGEVEKIHIELQRYEKEVEDSNKIIVGMFNKNMDFYDELQKYICAGQIALEELDNQILPEYKQKYEASADQRTLIEYEQLAHARDMVNQRIYDLKIAENIAIQTIPMLQIMKNNNYGLVRKINSAFVITLPVFKQCLAQAILVKKQQLQTKALNELDKKTNELLIKNAQNIANISIDVARMNSTSSISIETLEKTYNTIQNGIQETMKIQENSREEIKQNTVRLEQINTQIKNQRIIKQ